MSYQMCTERLRLSLAPRVNQTRNECKSTTGKEPPVVVAAIAREMAAFLWAIGREVAPA
jgi:hypothetical protein